MKQLNVLETSLIEMLDWNEILFQTIVNDVIADLNNSSNKQETVQNILNDLTNSYGSEFATKFVEFIVALAHNQESVAEA